MSVVRCYLLPPTFPSHRGKNLFAALSLEKTFCALAVFIFLMGPNQSYACKKGYSRTLETAPHYSITARRHTALRWVFDRFVGSLCSLWLGKRFPAETDFDCAFRNYYVAAHDIRSKPRMKRKSSRYF